MTSEPRALDRLLDDALAGASADGGAAFGLIYVAHEFLGAGRSDEARAIAHRAVAFDPGNPAVLRGASGVLFGAGDYAGCEPLCARAVALAPSDPELRQHFAIVLLARRDYPGAIAQLREQISLDPAASLAWRNLAGALQSLGEFDEALAASARAIDLDPGNEEFRAHRAGLFAQLGRPAEALDELRRIESESGQNATVAWLHAVMLDQVGELSAAVAHAERASRLAPANADFAEYADTLRGRLEVARRDGEAPAPRAQPDGDPLPPVPRQRPFGRALHIQANVIVALLIRETRTRFGDMKIGYVWAVIEPISHLLLIAAVFSATNAGMPPIGQSLLVYYFTGVVPYLMFSNTVYGVTHCLEANRHLLQLPVVRQTDVIVSRAVLELLTQTAVGVIILTGFLVIGLPAIPADPVECAVGLLMMWALAFGVGCCNAVIIHFVRSWAHLFNNVVRALYFTSGVFLSPLEMPDWVRDILSWNPVLQAIDWIRHGYFAGYEPAWLDRGYVVGFAAATLTLGFVLERALRRRLLAA